VPKLRITYNAPVVLTFAVVAVIVQILPDAAKSWFVSYPTFRVGTHAWVGLFTHIFGHANWQHLVGNFMLILLIGPILEERHGSLSLLGMIAITALVTGLANVVLGSSPILGASGVVFMMILLASTSNMKSGDIPLTFIAVALIYLGGEVVAAVRDDDHISHLAHLVGGLAGAAFGFIGALGATKRGVATSVTKSVLADGKPAKATTR
jgi:rhomboid protease GluP